MNPRDDVIQGQSKLMDRYEEALERILTFHTPSQPSHWAGTDEEWVQRHVRRLRRWAQYGLTGGDIPED